MLCPRAYLFIIIITFILLLASSLLCTLYVLSAFYANKHTYSQVFVSYIALCVESERFALLIWLFRHIISVTWLSSFSCAIFPLNLHFLLHSLLELQAQTDQKNGEADGQRTGHGAEFRMATQVSQ